MQTMIDNLVNGNLTDAKRQAKKFGKLAIAKHLREIGWSADKSGKAARYLKTGEGFQDYCDAK